MLVTLLGMATEVKEEQPRKAYPPMLVTLLGITKSVTNSPFKYRLWWGLERAESPKSILHHAARSVMCTEVKDEQS